MRRCADGRSGGAPRAAVARGSGADAGARAADLHGRRGVRRDARPISMPKRALQRLDAPSTPRPRRGSRQGRFSSAGFLEANARAIAVATSNGLFAYHRTTDADFSVTARTPDGTGSGWAQRRRARLECRRSGGDRPHRRAEGRGEPESAGDRARAVHGGARAAGRERSGSAAGRRAQRAQRRRRAQPFSKPGGGTRIGEKVADERVTLYSDPADPGLLGQPFDAEGLPLGRMVWIEKGVLKNLAYSASGRRSRGRSRQASPLAGGLALVGGTKSTEELIAGCERGILVTHFFYIRSLDPRTVLQTGLTRDGAFLIENGQDHASAEELPLEREPAADAEPARGHRPAGADRGRAADAGAARARLQLHLAVGRGVSRYRQSDRTGVACNR